MTPRPAMTLALGLFAGFVAGLFGIGGGVVIVPGLVLLLGFAQSRASGTSVATIIFSAAAGAASFALGDAVDWSAAASIAAGSVFGAFLGARFIEHVPVHWLARAFVVILLVAAVRLAI
ncbi:MAG: sulfite exporter TauE/SafE family protein [Acidimicrobiia bacterium]|nr:sulfite exporter TauE/SafE family protein [Acidimicrobiia bacterium]NNF70216.1 sulfite exporter TauE/SafE family protein [Acidimicrobiia bacterium]